jgi:hypothetical protein
MVEFGAMAHANTGTGIGGADMSIGTDTMIAHAGASADRANMRTRTDTIAADMGANAHTQNINANARAIGEGRARCQQAHRKNCNRQDFHDYSARKSNAPSTACGCANGWGGALFRCRGRKDHDQNKANMQTPGSRHQ